MEGYYDKRAEFWRRHFEAAKPLEEFLQGDPEKASRWRELAERVPSLTEEQKKRVQGFNRPLRVLVVAGLWCGDCARQAPMITGIARVAGPQVEVRFIDRDSNPELVDELRILGAPRVPRVVFLTEDYWEVDRVGDRLLPVYRAKAARELGRGVNRGILSPRALAEEQGAWVDVFERVLLMCRLAPPLRAKYGD